jgi:O-antigen/teichoic acid export membrane protein
MVNVVKGINWILKGRGGTAATIQTLLVRVSILIVNMATGIITARVLAPSGRGEQTAMGAWTLLLPYAMLLGLPSALVYNIKRHPKEQSEIFSAGLIMAIALGIVAAITGILLVPIWLKNYSAEVIHFAQWLMLFVPLVTLTEVVRASLEASEHFAVANQLRFLPPIITLLLLSLMALTGWLTPFTANLAYFLPSIPVLIWMLIPLKRLFTLSLHRFRASVWQLLNYGIRSYGIDLLTSLLVQLQQLVVVNLLAPAELGMYAVALSLANVLNIFQSSIVTILFPKASARPISEVVSITSRAARISAIVTLLAAIAAMVLGPILLGLLYGTAYLGAVPLFRLILVEVVLAGTVQVLAQAFMALNRPGTVAVLQGIGLALNFPLMLLLIPRFGLVGAGLALLGSTIIRLIFILMCYPLILKVRLPSVLVTVQDVQFLRQHLFKAK